LNVIISIAITLKTHHVGLPKWLLGKAFKGTNFF